MMTLATMLPNRASCRHVVFADPASARRQPYNFNPNAIAHTPLRDDGALEAEERSFVRWLFEQAGLKAADYRLETLARRLPACLRHLHVTSPRAARRVLEADPSLISSAIGTMVIGVTSFFRDPTVFHVLKSDLIPRLLSDSRRPLRIWSVGCSDGQELYTVAMILAELQALDQAYLLGTDCRAAATRHAARGIYGDNEVRSIPAEMLNRYFAPCPEGWRIDPRLRTLVQWRTADANSILEPGSWDIVLCRNFVMYLEPRRSSILWENLNQSISPGRFLITGKAERPPIAELRPVAPCIFRRY